MYINSRLCRLLATRFPEVISFDGSTTFKNIVMRLKPSSADPITPALERVLIDPPRLVASLTSLRRPDSRYGRRSLSFSSSFVAPVSSTSSSSTAVIISVASLSSTPGTVGVASSSSTDVTVDGPSSSTVSSLASMVRRSPVFDAASSSSVSPDPFPSFHSAWSSTSSSVSANADTSSQHLTSIQ